MKKEKKQGGILAELDCLLQMWEDINLHSRLIYRIAELTELGKLTKYVLPALSQARKSRSLEAQVMLGGVKDYEKFRPALVEANKKGIAAYHEPFLFKLPKDAGDVLLKNPVLYSVGRTWPCHSTPFFLAKWIRWKKSVEVSPDVLLEVVPVKSADDNYLKYLPYESFVLSFPEEIKLGRALVFKKCVCVVTGNILHVTCISSLVETLPFSEEDRAELIEHLGYAQNKLAKKLDMDPAFAKRLVIAVEKMKRGCSDFAYNIETGGMYIFGEETRSESGTVVHDVTPVSFDNPVFAAMPTDLFNTIHREVLWRMNGVGKLFYSSFFGNLSQREANGHFAHLKKPLHEIVRMGQEPEVKTVPNPETPWNLVENENIMRIEKKKGKDGVKITSYTPSGQKCKHVRGAHYNYYWIGGERKEKWLLSTVVRADRTGPIKGSTSKVVN